MPVDSLDRKDIIIHDDKVLLGAVRLLDSGDLLFQRRQGAKFRFQLRDRAELTVSHTAMGQLGEIDILRLVLVINVVDVETELLA